MRASCETDWLNSGIKAHVVAHMMGHSVKVQPDHYAQVTDSDFGGDQTAELSQTENRSLCASDDAESGKQTPNTSERDVSGM